MASLNNGAILFTESIRVYSEFYAGVSLSRSRQAALRRSRADLERFSRQPEGEILGARVACDVIELVKRNAYKTVLPGSRPFPVKIGKHVCALLGGPHRCQEGQLLQLQ